MAGAAFPGDPVGKLNALGRIDVEVRRLQSLGVHAREATLSHRTLVRRENFSVREIRHKQGNGAVVEDVLEACFALLEIPGGRSLSILEFAEPWPKKRVRGQRDGCSQGTEEQGKC